MARSIIARAEYRAFSTIRKKRLKNKNISVIANNCNGGVMIHDLGVAFLSPTVNIGIWPCDYIKFLKKLDYYISLTPVNCNESFDGGYFARLDDIKVLFNHVKNFEEGFNNWERRKKRLDINNLYVVFCDKMGCTYEIIKEFDELPIEHKVIFTHKPYPEFKSAYYIKGFENEDEVGVLSDWKPGFFKRRWLDDFDYVKWFNTGKLR